MIAVTRFRYIVLSLYLVYALSPLVGRSSSEFTDGLTNCRASTTIAIFYVQELLTGLFDGVDTSNSDSAEDFLLRKLRIIPAGTSLMKKILIVSHVMAPDSDDRPFEVSGNAWSHYRPFIPHAAAQSVKGFSRHFSGLSPPYLLS